MKPEIVVEKAGAFAERAAAEISDRLSVALSVRERVSLALAGGVTPRPVHRRLSRPSGGLPDLDWSRVEFFWGDERLVRAGSSDSNFETARRDLLEPLGVPPGQIHAPARGIDAHRVAECYENAIRARLGAAPEEIPRFDLVLLGLGTDGHTASLFPGAEPEPSRLVVAARGPAPPRSRVSFTFELLAAARQVLFLVTGEDKAEIVRRVIEDGDASLPAARVRPADGRLGWILDAGAASLLPANRVSR